MSFQIFSGEWVDSTTGNTYERENPACTTEIVGSFQDAGPDDVDAAVAIARDRQSAWSAIGHMGRAQVLRRSARELRDRADGIGRDLAREAGKTLAEGTGEIHRAAGVFDYFAGLAELPTGSVLDSATPGVALWTHREPLGVVAAITPFNFPAFVPSFKLAAALAAGNAVIWKPAPTTPMTGVRIMDVLTAAGVPAGVLAYLTGTRAELGQAIVAHSDVAAISFTGSTAVGRAVGRAAAERSATTQLEMGGKNAMVVLADSDLHVAATLTATGSFSGTGQKCTATSRVFVERSVHDDFLDLLTQKAKALRVGNGMEDDVDIGPLISSAALKRVVDCCGIGTGEGAKALTGGTALTDGEHRDGYFMPPTVFADADPSMCIAREEIFGPVVAVMAVDGYDEALRLTNDSPYGLTAAICTRDLDRAHDFAAAAQVGVVNVNMPTTGVDHHAPFGGIKDSGTGPKELGPTGMDFFSTTRTVVMRAG